MGIFRAYDIRGVYPHELNDELAYKIGLAFGKLVQGTVAIGMDARKSGPALKKSLLKGLLESGLHVIDLGMVPTPVFYFFVSHEKLDGGICITGSHNPKEYNGFKIVGKNGICLSYETGINKIERFIKEGITSPKLKGVVENEDAVKKYIDYVKSAIRIKRPLKIVIDSGNGVGGLVAPKLFRELGCEVIDIYSEPDGDFPNHHPDPLVAKNLADLQKKVKEVSADLGIAYDGDADRVGFVDEKGEIVPNNHAFALLIKNVLKHKPGSKILYEVLSSKLIEDVIKENGGIPVLSRVGHSYIQQKMFEENCVLGGETSGHYYFSEMYNNDDGIFASAKMVEMITSSGKNISELVKEFPKYFTSQETRVQCPDEKKFEVIESLKKKFKKEGYKVITVDGVKVVFENGSWFIIRASNTQPALVLRWEAKDKDEFKRLGNFVINLIRKEKL